MQNRLSCWFKGFVYICICGDGKYRFVNLCHNRRIKLWQIHYNDDKILACIDAAEYKKLLQISKKTDVIPKIVAKVGLPFIFTKYKYRKPLILGVLIGIFIMYICSLFIWNISIYGENTYTEETLRKYLEDINVREGMKIKSVKCQEIENSVRKKYTDIGWVSVEIVGTRLLVNIKENDVPKKDIQNNNKSDIISQHDGEVTYIFTRKGTPLVTAGTKIKKGDILVKGEIDILNDAGEIANVEECHADADIFIKHTINYEDSFMVNYEHKEYDKKSKKRYSLIINNTKFGIFNTVKGIDNYDIIVKACDFEIIDNFYLPFSLEISEYKPYVISTRTYTEDEVKEKCMENFKRYKSLLEDNGADILNEKLSFTINSNLVLANGYITTIEKAGIE